MTEPGWRSRRWGNGGAQLLPPQTVAVGPTSRTQRGAVAPQAHVSIGPLPEHGDWRVWRGVDFDLAFVAFCAYMVSIITYLAPIGDYSIALAILGVATSGKFRLPTPMVFFAAFLLWCLLGYASSDFPEQSWAQLDKDFRIFVIVVIGVNVLTNTRRVRFFSLLTLAAFGAYPIRGAVLNYFFYGAATDGRIGWNFVFENPNDLAAYCLIPFGLCASMLHVEKDRYIRYCAMIGLAIIPLVIFLTGSRGAMLGLGTFGVAALISERRYRGKMLMAATAALIILGAFAPKSSWDRLLSLTAADSNNLAALDDSGSARQRFEIWRVARAIVTDNPIVGVGTGAYKYVHYLYVARRAGFDQFAKGMRDTHSTYLNVAAETGYPGALLFSSIFISTLLFAGRVKRTIVSRFPARASYLQYLSMSIVAFATCAIFGSYVHIAFAYLLSILLWCSAWTFDHDAKMPMSSPR